MLNDDSLDVIWGQIRIEHKRVLVGSVYTKPTTDTDNIKLLLEHIKKVKQFGNISSHQ